MTLCLCVIFYSSWEYLFTACSEHEWQLAILDSVAHVHAAVKGSVAAVVAEVAGPDLRSDGGYRARCVTNNRPAMIWLVV